MEPVSNLYEDAALVYTRLVEYDSLSAAAAIRQIHTTAGAHAALRAALIIRLLKMEVQQNHFVPTISIYGYLFKDYPEAVELLEQSIAVCLQTWGIRDVEVQLNTGDLRPSSA